SPEVQLTPVGELLDEKKFFNKILKNYIENISKMHDFAHSRGVKFLLVFQPELGNKKVISEDEKKSLESWNIRFKYLDRKIPEIYKLLISGTKKVLHERKISFIDINDEPEFSENIQTLFFDVVHPNELGHKIIAKIINRAISTGIQNIAMSRLTTPLAHEETDAISILRCTLSFGDGWHAWEHNGSGWWRWTNKRGEIRVVALEDSDVLMYGEISSIRSPNTVDV